MDKLELLKNIRETTKTTIDSTLNYATKSIMPHLYADKTDLLIDLLVFALLGFALLIFYYFGAGRNKSKVD